MNKNINAKSKDIQSFSLMALLLNNHHYVI